MNWQVDKDNLGPCTLYSVYGGLPSVRGAVVDDPEDSFGKTVGRLSHNLTYKTLKRPNTGLCLATSKDLRAPDIPRRDIGQCATSFILMFDSHGLLAPWGQSCMFPNPGLYAGLFISGNYVFIGTQPLALPDSLVQI